MGRRRECKDERVERQEARVGVSPPIYSSTTREKAELTFSFFLRKLVKHVLTRSTEATARPSLISQLRDVITSSTSFHSSAVANNSIADTVQRFTTDELSNLTKLVSDAATWLEDTIKKQDKLKGHQDPVLRVSDLEKKIKDVENEVKKLAKKKIPRAKKVKATSASEQEKEKETAKAEHKKDEL